MILSLAVLPGNLEGLIRTREVLGFCSCLCSPPGLLTACVCACACVCMRVCMRVCARTCVGMPLCPRQTKTSWGTVPGQMGLFSHQLILVNNSETCKPQRGYKWFASHVLELDDCVEVVADTVNLHPSRANLWKVFWTFPSSRRKDCPGSMAPWLCEFQGEAEAEPSLPQCTYLTLLVKKNKQIKMQSINPLLISISLFTSTWANSYSAIWRFWRLEKHFLLHISVACVYICIYLSTTNIIHMYVLVIKELESKV